MFSSTRGDSSSRPRSSPGATPCRCRSSSAGLTLLEAPPETDVQLFGINRHGHVVGTIESDLSMSGTIWKAGRPISVAGLAPEDQRLVRLLDVNDKGSLLGQVWDTVDICLEPVRFLVE